MSFCSQCGTQINEQAKFCSTCGTSLTSLSPLSPQANTPFSPPPLPAQPAYQPAPPIYQTEPIKIMIANLNMDKSWGRKDTFNLIVTERRSIFAKLTSEIMNETVKNRRAKAAGEGKGFWGQYKAQLSGFNNYTDRYVNMSPDQILNETPGNFAIDNSTIKKVKASFSTDEDATGYDIEFQTATQKYKFTTNNYLDKILKQTYGPLFH